MSRTQFYKDEDMLMSYEIIEACLFVHVEFTRFSKSILSRLREVWKVFQQVFYFEGYEFIFTYTRDPRIVNIIGGAEEIGQDNPDLVNLNTRMFKWELN